MTATSQKKRPRPGHRSTASAIAILFALLRVGAPLVVIAAIAFWFLNLRSAGTGFVHVTTSIPGADILIGGVMTGLRSDTTLSVPVGRKIVTVRKAGYVSEPEFVVLEVQKKGRASASFVLKSGQSTVRSDTILPLRPVRQEVFETGERVTVVPPVAPRLDRRGVDFSQLRDRDKQGTELASQRPEFPSPAFADSEFSSSAVAVTSLIGTEVTVSSNPEGADIWVNGAATTRTTPYTFRGLDRGIYVFTIQRAGFRAKPDSIVVGLTQDYQSTLVAFDLTSDIAVPRPTLSIATQPLAAGFRVDGRTAGMGRATLEMEYGKHRIEFSDVPGYRTPSPTTVVLSDTQRYAEVTGTYEKLAGNAYLAVLPSPDIGKFDGTLLHVLVDNELLLDAPKERYDGALLGKIASGKRLVRIQYGDLITDAHVDFTDGQVTEVTFRIESFFSKRRLKLRSKTGIGLEEWQTRAKNLAVLTLS